MGITFLIVQILLGVVFLMAGAMKVMAQEKARVKMPVLQKYPKGFITFIGLAEVAGALGITLPIWLNIYPALTAHAAGGLGLIMLGAIGSHVPRKEWPQTLMALIFLIGLVYIITVTV